MDPCRGYVERFDLESYIFSWGNVNSSAVERKVPFFGTVYGDARTDLKKCMPELHQYI